MIIRVEATPGLADAALDAAFAAVAELHARLSFHDPRSELSHLNREAARRPVRVSSALARVLRASLALARVSAGRFDPTCAARLVDWGQLPRPLDAPDANLHADWRDVEMLPDRHVYFRQSLWLDFGGIAKGYAVDRAVAALRARGIRAGQVNAGGDLRVFGPIPETIQVRHPGTPTRAIALLQLCNGAAATSAGYFSARAGRTALVDTHNDGHLGDGVSVTVCAPRAQWADALTKVVLADAQAALPLLRRLGAQASLLDVHGRMRRIG